MFEVTIPVPTVIIYIFLVLVAVMIARWIIGWITG